MFEHRQLTLLVHGTTHRGHGTITNTIIGSGGRSGDSDIGHLTRNLASQSIDQSGVLVGTRHGARLHLVHGCSHGSRWSDAGVHGALCHHARPRLGLRRYAGAGDVAAAAQTIQRSVGQTIGSGATVV